MVFQHAQRSIRALELPLCNRPLKVGRVKLCATCLDFQSLLSTATVILDLLDHSPTTERVHGKIASERSVDSSRLSWHQRYSLHLEELGVSSAD